MNNSDISIRDPFVVNYNGCYYLYGTRACSFGIQTGGFDVYTGTDLINWSEPKQVFDSEKWGLNSQANWAPEVHYYNGAFYMFATFAKENGLRGTYILKSETPDGEFIPWSKGAVTPYEWESLDGTFFMENDKPYCVFCHEHTQILNGTVCAVELAPDLKTAENEPVLLFSASDYLNEQASEKNHLVTDGPFLFRHKSGSLIMIWSTGHNGYQQCVAESKSGSLFGEWRHLKPLFTDDGGHGMIFVGLDGKLYLTLHYPNSRDNERPVFFELAETENTLETLR